MRYLLLLGLLIFGTNINAQSLGENLKPTIKTTKSVMYNVKNNKLINRENFFGENISSYGMFSTHIKNDENGKILEETTFRNSDSEYKILYTKIYERDKKGNLIKTIDNSKRGENYSINEFDSNDNIIETKFFYKNNLTKAYSYKYDSNNNMIKVLLKHNSDIRSTKDWKELYKYNSDNKKKAEMRYLADGLIEDQVVYKLQSQATYKYDENSVKKTELTDYSTKITVTEFDKMENILITSKKSFNRKNKLTYQIIESIDYVYDKYGNWITLKLSRDGVLKYVIEKQIEYYE
jgi:hypothetical protein